MAPFERDLFRFAVGCRRSDWSDLHRDLHPIERIRRSLPGAGQRHGLLLLPGHGDGDVLGSGAFVVRGIETVPARAGEVDLRPGKEISCQGQLDQARAALRSLQAGERPEERLRRETQLRAAEARLVNARAESERNAVMVRSQAISRQEFDRGETACRVAMKAIPGVTALPGMTATVTVTYRRAGILGSRMLVPISAVLKDRSGEQVAWVLGADQTVMRRPIRTGEVTGARIEIVEGLQPGDRIAVAGVSFLRDGMKVRDLGDALGGGRP